MKKSFRLAKSITLIILLMSAYGLYSQEGHYREMQQKKERIEAHKVAFITDRLDLSSTEAEKFWPVYNAFQKELREKQQSWRKEHGFNPEDIAEMTDAEAEKIAQVHLNHEQEILEMKRELLTDLKGIISPQKILILFEAEKQFRVDLMRRVSQGRASGVGRNDTR